LETVTRDTGYIVFLLSVVNVLEYGQLGDHYYCKEWYMLMNYIKIAESNLFSPNNSPISLDVSEFILAQSQWISFIMGFKCRWDMKIHSFHQFVAF